jgi:catechol 2,3-dioxygenase-like lactoylglutathione lyase family enzyme
LDYSRTSPSHRRQKEEKVPDFPDSRATVDPLLAVSDLPRSLAFWVDLVGAEPVTTWDAYALLRIGSGHLHLAVTGDPPPDRGVRLEPPDGRDDRAVGEVVIRVEDCAAVVGELERRGVRFLGPASTPPWGGEVRAFAWDPDHHLLEITSPA